jgi:hypothetical protein
LYGSFIIIHFTTPLTSLANIPSTLSIVLGRLTALPGSTHITAFTVDPLHGTICILVTVQKGPIACRATSKLTGTGALEQGWADNKEIKSGKRSHLSVDKLKKQGLPYTSSDIRRAQVEREELERPDCNAPSAVWGEEDEQFELGLEKWGVDLDDLKKPIRPHKLFKAWLEEWRM